MLLDWSCTAVSYLRCAGASDKALLEQTGRSALLDAIIHEGLENMVRLLLDEGMEAVGGIPAMPMAFEVAIGAGRATMLQRLQAVQVGQVSPRSTGRSKLCETDVYLHSTSPSRLALFQRYKYFLRPGQMRRP